MKFARFINPDCQTKYGLVTTDHLIELTGNPFTGYTKTDKHHYHEDIRLLSPCSPSKIVAVGLNYKDHAREMNREIPAEPMLFMKPGTAVTGSGNNIVYPGHMSERVDYEGELAVVISKEARMVSEENAYEHVLGYTCINDVTARDLQSRDIQFTRAKGFDSFAPLGPYIETELDTSDLEIKSYLNGEVRQSSNTNNLIFNVPRLISFITGVMTLLPGDVIATGTPGGIGSMNPGDVIEIEIEGIGRLKNKVV